MTTVPAVRVGCVDFRFVIDHMSIQCADLAASAAFYDAVLAPLGGTRLLEYEDVIGYGTGGKPSFWLGPLGTPEKGAAERPGEREVHIAFHAATTAAVQEFFAAAVDAGAPVLHSPRVWPDYHPDYFGAFVRDPDGNNVEAVCHAPG